MGNQPANFLLLVYSLFLFHPDPCRNWGGAGVGGTLRNWCSNGTASSSVRWVSEVMGACTLQIFSSCHFSSASLSLHFTDVSGCCGLGKTYPHTPATAGEAQPWNQGWGRLWPPSVTFSMKAHLYRDSRPGLEAEAPHTAPGCSDADTLSFWLGHSSCVEPQASLSCLSQPHPDPDPARIHQVPSGSCNVPSRGHAFQGSGPGPPGLLALPSPRRPQWTKVRGGNQHLADLLPASRGPPGKSWEGILLSLLEYTAKKQSPLLLS